MYFKQASRISKILPTHLFKSSINFCFHLLLFEDVYKRSKPASEVDIFDTAGQ